MKPDAITLGRYCKLTPESLGTMSIDLADGHVVKRLMSSMIM